jgi:SAM-dependent methyltransferase
MYEPPPYVLAPFVPTPREVVERMLALASVDASDTVFDLGCGDGRVLIGAAASRGCRGVGVDIEPYWVERSRANAELAGVAHLLTFHVRDALSTDLSDASVVFLYLVHWSTQLMAARLFQQVSPGTRVVSHGFPIDSLAPHATHSVADESGVFHHLYLWVATGEELPGRRRLG